ncbi:MAG TPA: Gldg family protein [Kofleriaceae bacterium]|nr:Gldg family protein [Kofleriaceae bacterium]
MIWTVAKKELRGYFNSAVAVIFLAAFLGVALYTFFWHEKFFARGLADLRPLFEWMPKLLIILVSALAMRQWADERRAGTLEVLLTLPVPRWKLVVGKFLAGVLLIAVALGLTLGLPITISMMGNLDTGPVLGGYLAALLLSAAYLSIGMCVSAATDNQIVAFVGTALLCVIAYAIGGDGSSALGRALGTGTRFESVARGVLDLRDLAYYGTIMVIGLALNVLMLGRLTWGRGPRARRRRIGAVLGVVLVAANALALDLWLAPIGRARIDMTQGGMFSLSSSTKDILAALDERLLIRGYFSEKTHPLLAPLVPQIRDLLEEYRVAGGSKVRVEMLDPTESDEQKTDAKERFGIDSTPLPFESNVEQSIVNAYFAIAIEYGDQHVVLGLRDLIQERRRGASDTEVTLKNPEYQLTSSIKKVVSGFSSLDTLFASAAQPIRLIAYMTPKTLPKNLEETPEKLKKVVDELVKDAKGKLVYIPVEPKLATNPQAPDARQEMQEIRQKHGAEAYQTLGSDKIFYFHVVVENGDRIEIATPPPDAGDAAIKSAITDALKRSSPGFRKVVGMWVPPAPPPLMFGEGAPPQRVPPPQTFEALQEALSSGYEVRTVALDARVPDDVQVLLLCGPANLDAKAAESIDQFVMRGGALVVLGGRFRIDPMAQTIPGLEKVTTGLEAALEKWGIKIDEDLVLDTKNEVFISLRQVPGGPRTLQQGPYAMHVKITDNQLGSSIISSGLPGTVMTWASPVSAEAKVGDDEHRVDVLLRSSDEAWTSKSTDGVANWKDLPKTGFPGPSTENQRSAQTLAVAVVGAFASSVAKKGEAGAGAGSADKRLLERSPASTRIVVFGSSSFASDDVLRLAQQLHWELVVSNLQLVQNAVDWALADTDLLAIRGRTTAARAITVDPDARSGWQTKNIIIAFIALAAVVGLAWFRRRAVRPLVTAKEV